MRFAKPKVSRPRSSASSCPPVGLQLVYHGEQVADLSMEFLHGGRPPVVREAIYTPAPAEGRSVTGPRTSRSTATNSCCRILGSLNVCSKEWVIRQYDHEVQGGSVIKPLVGVANDGPSDAAVVRPVLGFVPRAWRSPAA